MIYQETLRMLKKAAEPSMPANTTWDSMKKDLLAPRGALAPFGAGMINRPKKQPHYSTINPNLVENARKQYLTKHAPMAIGAGTGQLHRQQQKLQQYRQQHPFPRPMMPSSGLTGQKVILVP